MKKICYRHKFKRVGKSCVGMTVEKYVQCKECGMTIVILNLHRKFFEILSDAPKPQYFERKKMNIRKRRHEVQHSERMLALLEDGY